MDLVYAFEWHWLTCALEKQTMAFNIKARVDFKNRERVRMSVWEAMELLNTLVDESDPDVSILVGLCCRNGV